MGNQKLIEEALSYKVLAATIWGEARGEPFLGQIAVGNVIKNRSSDHRWPSGIKEVCLQKYQFSCWLPNDPNYKKVVDHLLPSDYFYDPIFRQCFWIAYGIYSDYITTDLTNGANHYYAASMKRKPSWADPSKLVTQIGNHKFYKL